jgi:hypothetical protein
MYGAGLGDDPALTAILTGRPAMTNKSRFVGASICTIAAVVMVGVLSHTVRSADMNGASAQPPATGTIDRVMAHIVAGRIDDALAAIDFLKEQPDTRAVLRDRLTRITNTQQQHCYGYDVAAVQRFSDRLQSVAVLAYYDQQPYLFRFELYHPQGKADEPWLIQELSIHPNVTEELKDTPVEYWGGRVAAPR